MSKHTTGPWSTSVDGHRTTINTTALATGPLARIPHASDNVPRHEFEANARLIAAAPEMLEMLKVAAARIGWATDTGVEILKLIDRIESGDDIDMAEGGIKQ